VADPYCLHPALLVHTMWVAGRRRLVAQVSSATPPLVLHSPLALTALGVLPAEFNRDEAGASWADLGVGAEVRAELWDAFAAAAVIVPAAGAKATWWDDFEWREARTYHQATAGVGEPAVLLERLAPGQSPDERLAQLSDVDRRGPNGIGLLLDVCFGERDQVRVAGGHLCLLKSIPSGGARHPTEVFLAAFDLDGILPAVYHYNVEHHRLDRVRKGQHRDAFTHATLDLFERADQPPAAALVFTSRVERAMWRYRDPRSFRAVMVDVGHAMMAFRHAAELLGFRALGFQKMRDGEIAGLCAVDRVTQPPIYVATLGP